jgi:hypothetical protein
MESVRASLALMALSLSAGCSSSQSPGAAVSGETPDGGKDASVQSSGDASSPDASSSDNGGGTDAGGGGDASTDAASLADGSGAEDAGECAAGFHACSSACSSNASIASCGTSCAACLAPGNATATCDGTACGFTCKPGFSLCNGVCAASCRYGYTNITCNASNPANPFGANYLLGEQISIPVATTVSALAITTTSSGYNGIIALYDSSASGGLAGARVAQTGSTAMTNGVNEVAITPVAVAAGSYWIMADYSSDARMCVDGSSTNPIEYMQFTFGMPAPASLSGDGVTAMSAAFGYYVVTQ